MTGDLCGLERDEWVTGWFRVRWVFESETAGLNVLLRVRQVAVLLHQSSTLMTCVVRTVNNVVLGSRLTSHVGLYDSTLPDLFTVKTSVEPCGKGCTVFSSREKLLCSLERSYCVLL